MCHSVNMDIQNHILPNFSDELLTVALRPTMMYGEQDHLFMPTIMKVAHNFNQQIPKFFGPGGKHQITYVGKCCYVSTIFR